MARNPEIYVNKRARNRKDALINLFEEWVLSKGVKRDGVESNETWILYTLKEKRGKSYYANIKSKCQNISKDGMGITY